MESLWHDLRLGVRGLAKSPGFTIIALITLALGIGANTAMFTVLNAVLLRTLPVEDPQQLVILSNPESQGIGVGDGSGKRYLYAYSEFQDLRDHNQVFSGILAADSSIRKTDVSVEGASGAGEGERANINMVSGDYFRILGVRPVLGRTFGNEVDKIQHANPVAVISYGYWQSRFALDPSILSRKIRVRETTFDIIGVAQPGFAGVTVGAAVDLWVPLTMQAEVFPGWTNFLDRAANPLEKIFWLHMIARLKPGITREQAQQSINLTMRQLREGDVGGMAADRRREYLDSRITLSAGARGANMLSDTVGEPLKILMAVVGLVLLIACANVANLVLARGTRRQREIAVRLALGAGRRRVLQQLLLESLLLAAAGGTVGLILAQWTGLLLVRLVSTPDNPIFLDIHPDLRILAFTFGLSLFTGILFGLAPGLRAAGLELDTVLKGAGKGSVRGGGTGSGRAGRMLVAGQVALSFALLMVAGLFVRSFQNLVRQDPGFEHDHLLSFDLGFLEASGYKGATIHQVHTQLLERLRSIPQVQGATLAFMGLFVGNDTGTHISVDGSHPKSDSAHRVRHDLVPSNYFSVIGQRLLMGREFTTADERSTELVGVVNQSFVRKFFPDSNPLGKRITFDYDHPRDLMVVGVVVDSKHNSLREPATPELWLPFFSPSDDERSFCTFHVRYKGDKAAVAAAIRAAVKDVAPAVPPVQVRTMNELMGQTLLTERAISQLSGAFGLLALILASIGLYGVMAHNVAARTNEIGIRVALGAQPRDIIGIVLRETVVLIAAGLAFGAPSLFAAKRWISTQLFGLSPLDPATIGGAVLVLAAVTVLAGYIPARWASRVDPTVALHYE